MTTKNTRALLLTTGALTIAALTFSVFDSNGTSPTSDSPQPTLDLSRPSIWSADAVAQFVQDAQDIDPEIRSWQTFDIPAQEWTYNYTVINKPTSQNPIWKFAVDPILQPNGISTPEHWSHYHGFQERDNAVVWAVTDAGAAPVGWDSVSVYPGSFDVQPGDSTTGFSIRSVFPPILVSYFVQGFNVTTPSVEEEGGGVTFTLFQNSVTGLIMGPSTTLVGVDSGGIRPQGGLRAPIPNPSASRVTITFNLPTATPARLAVYDVSGRLLRVLADGTFPEGVHSVAWDGFDSHGRPVVAGVYFYKLVVDNKPAGERRVIILR